MAIGGSFNKDTFRQTTPFETWAQVQGVGLYWDTENQFAAGRPAPRPDRGGGHNYLGTRGPAINYGGRDYGSQPIDRGELQRAGTGISAIMRGAQPIFDRLQDRWARKQATSQRYAQLRDREEAILNRMETLASQATNVPTPAPSAPSATSGPGSRSTRRPASSQAPSATMPVSPGQPQPTQGPAPMPQGPTSKWPNPTDPVEAANKGLAEWRAKQVPPSSRWPNPTDPTEAANKGLSEWLAEQRKPPVSSYPNPSDPNEAVNKGIGDMLRAQQRVLHPEEPPARFLTNKELFDANRSLNAWRERRASAEEGEGAETLSAPTPASRDFPAPPAFAPPQQNSAVPPPPVGAVGDQSSRLAAEGVASTPSKKAPAKKAPAKKAPAKKAPAAPKNATPTDKAPKKGKK